MVQLLKNKNDENSNTVPCALASVLILILFVIHLSISSGSVVRLSSHNDEEVTILGIDDYGYLRVRTNKTRELLSLQHDGNTFDIMKGLIATKPN